MAQLSIPNLDETVLDRLQARAKAHGHSLQTEVKRVLETLARQPAATQTDQRRETTMRMPLEDHGTPRFAPVEAVEIKGRPASQMLIEDRQ